MQYRVHIKKFTKNLWSFHTPVLQYPQLPVRNIFQNSLVSGIDAMLEEAVSLTSREGFGDLIPLDDDDLPLAQKP